jgi:ribosomal-protein-alanine N-acetyltransferase
VTNVAVDPDWHRRRVGTRLLVALAHVAIERGCRHLSLEVRVSNARAIHLYEAAGFRTTGVRRGYYTDNREDAYVMWKDPIPPAGDGVGSEESASRAGGKVLRG